MKKKIPDILLATRKGNREAEFEIKGPGFHSNTKVVKSKKNYTRKIKHKNDIHY